MLFAALSPSCSVFSSVMHCRTSSDIYLFLPLGCTSRKSESLVPCCHLGSDSDTSVSVCSISTLTLRSIVNMGTWDKVESHYLLDQFPIYFASAIAENSGSTHAGHLVGPLRMGYIRLHLCSVIPTSAVFNNVMIFAIFLCLPVDAADWQSRVARELVFGILCGIGRIKMPLRP